MSTILNGLRVVEVSAFIAAPLGGMTLAQLGAEVIRIDPIGGNIDYRRWPLAPSGASLYWASLNKGKRSIAIALDKPEGQELASALIAQPGEDAGILLTNLPASGWMGHDVLSQRRDDLISLRLTGNHDGSGAVDYTVNCASGFPLATGVGAEPVNHVLPAWDLLTGAYAAFALLAAIQRRSVSGEGGEVRIPLSDVAIGTVANLGGIAEVLYSGENRPRLGNAVYGLFGRDFVTADGQRTMIVVVTPRQWSNLIAALGLEGPVAAVEAERGVSFAKDDGLRYDHRDALFPLFEAAIGARSHADLAAALDAGGIVHSAYRTMLDAARDPRLVGDNPMFSAFDANPSGFAYPAAGPFCTVPQLERGAPQPAPRNGQHSEQVLAERLKLSSGEIARLIDSGIVGTQP